MYVCFLGARGTEGKEDVSMVSISISMSTSISTSTSHIYVYVYIYIHTYINTCVYVFW